MGVRPGAGRLAAGGLAVAAAGDGRGTSTLPWAAGQQAPARSSTAAAARDDSRGIVVVSWLLGTVMDTVPGEKVPVFWPCSSVLRESLRGFDCQGKVRIATRVRVYQGEVRASRWWVVFSLGVT